MPDDPYDMLRELVAAAKKREEESLRLKSIEDHKKQEVINRYSAKSQEVGQEIPSNIAYNPKSTNWLFSLSGERMAQQPYMQGLTNMPNTLVASGHGRPSYIPGVGSGLYPDSSVTNKLSQLVRERKVIMDDNFQKLLGKMTSTSGGVSLSEIAKGIGSQTNDVKRVILMSCFTQGATPEEIRKHFPNASEIISSSPNQKFASTDSFNDLFRSMALPRQTNELTPYVSPLYRQTPTNTNEIRQVSDWMDPTEQVMNRYRTP